MNTEIGKFLVSRIQLEARRAKPLNNSRSFPSLKSITKQHRDYLKKFNSTHGAFKSGRSNLTFTGQLIDAITFKVKKGLVEIFVEKSSRTPYKTGPNSTAKGTPNNNKLAEILGKIGFVFMTKKGLESDPQIRKRVNNIVRRFLRRSLAKK